MIDDTAFTLGKRARGVLRWPAGTDLTKVYNSPEKGTLAMVDGVLFVFNGTAWVDFLARVTALEAPPSFGIIHTGTAGLSVPHNAFTDIGNWNATEFGSSSAFSYTSGHITIPATGLYRFDVEVLFRASNTTGQRIILLGTATADTGTRLAMSNQTAAPDATFPTTAAIHKTLSLTAGDSVYLYGYQNSGASLAVFDANVGGYRDFWQVRKIG